MAMELGESRAAILRRAHELEQEHVPGLEQVAADLRAQATRMGGSEAPASDAARIAEMLRLEDLRDAGERPLTALQQPCDIAPGPMLALPSPAARKRGRPRKSPEIQTDHNAPDGETR